MPSRQALIHHRRHLDHHRYCRIPAAPAPRPKTLSLGDRASYSSFLSTEKLPERERQFLKLQIEQEMKRRLRKTAAREVLAVEERYR